MATEVIATDEFRDWYRELTLKQQASVEHIVGMLEDAGTALPFPYSSGVTGSQFAAMRELRMQHAGEPYRILYAFDPVRQAVLLVGGVKTGKGNRWYKEAIRIADRLFKEYLRGF